MSRACMLDKIQAACSLAWMFQAVGLRVHIPTGQFLTSAWSPSPVCDSGRAN